MANRTLIVIGGGIIGHMVAWKACAADPSLKVTLIERDLPGAGASARAAGLHFPFSRTPAGREFSLSSQQFYQSALRLVPALPITSLDLRIHCAATGHENLQDVVTDGAQLDMDPEGSATAAALGSHLPVWRAVGANRADVLGLVIAIRRILAGRVHIVDGLMVRTILENDDGVAVETDDGCCLTANRLVLAPGPWALDAPFLPYTDALGIRIKRIVAFHVDEVVRRTAVDLFWEADAFFMPRSDDGTLFSFTRLEWDVSPDDAGRGISAADRDEAEAVIAHVAPRLSGKLLGGQTFCDAYSSNRVPIATAVGTGGRIAFAGAANGAGYRFAPAIADRALASIGLESGGQHLI
ncbi:FAD-dependent oxidoreductase [Burkholderia ambifaria]|uniref:FAD-dependent oxidoreductase n=1 Tax=Burkholderia ambifaria TaxID=152480 RepID=UPI00158E92AC|nr:FAD-dependent oxidoreductase [Burkholderia ambifaria]MBR8343535.1 FAD-dependent oxidoreductase [Burkholderia ambifaria]